MAKLKQLSLVFAVFVHEKFKIKSQSHVKVLPDEMALMRPLKRRRRGSNGGDGGN